MRDEEIIREWEEREQPESEIENPCCECGDVSDYQIDGRCYCQSCAEDVFKFFDDNETECSNCGDEIEESYFSINGEVLCPACFEEIFRR